MSRPSKGGHDVGPDYQRNCIASWKDAGFTEIISVNSKDEIEASADLQTLARESGIRIASVDRDASAITGKPNIFLTDLLNVARTLTSGKKFAFINADIILVREAHVMNHIMNEVAPKRFLMARRSGITEPSQLIGDLYFWGFDFFAVHTTDVEAMPDLGLVIGAPWWDYYFPITMCLRGAVPFQPSNPAILHLDHEERWNWRTWHELGHSNLREMFLLLSTLAPNVDAFEYAASLHRAVERKSGNWLSDFAYHTRKILPMYARQEPEKILRRVAYTNVLFLDRYKSLAQTPKEVNA